MLQSLTHTYLQFCENIAVILKFIVSAYIYICISTVAGSRHGVFTCSRGEIVPNRQTKRRQKYFVELSTFQLPVRMRTTLHFQNDYCQQWQGKKRSERYMRICRSIISLLH